MRIKNLLIVLAALIFGFGVVLVSARKVSQAQVLGENEVAEEESVEVTESEEKEEGVDYYLPYPGILPDHPLYWVKMLRDRIMLALARDPMAKFDRLLLYADKRLGAAKVLIEGGKKELGVATATKGEKYLERVVTQFNQLKDQGKTTPELMDRLKRASLKHQEVLEGVLEKVPDQAKPAIQQAMEKSRHGYETAMQAMGKKGEDQEQEQEQEQEREEGSEGGQEQEQEQEREREQQGKVRGIEDLPEEETQSIEEEKE